MLWLQLSVAGGGAGEAAAGSSAQDVAEEMDAFRQDVEDKLSRLEQEVHAIDVRAGQCS